MIWMKNSQWYTIRTPSHSLMFKYSVTLKENYAALCSGRAQPGTPCCMPIVFLLPHWKIPFRMNNICDSAEVVPTTPSSKRKQANSNIERGYSRSCLRKAYNRMAAKSQNKLLFKSISKKATDCDPTRIILRFSKQHKQIKEIIQRHWTIFRGDPKVQKFISNVPSITFKRATK